MERLRRAKKSEQSFSDMNAIEIAEYIKETATESFQTLSEKTVQYGGIVAEKTSEIAEIVSDKLSKFWNEWMEQK